ncbi:MAG: hypothetical protein E6Q97_20165 [Desulfurellales bacterium]|nr:MAG: hypothetical protein E6Q97_20165 [Desulfurellales bacterium]
MHSTHVVIFHAHCPDGMAAAWAARTGLRLDGVADERIEYRAMRYGDSLDLESVEGKRVLIADFSFSRQRLVALNEVAAHVAAFDHHKTAAADLAGLPFCRFDMNRSGAGLVWDEFVCRESHQFPRPWVINYVEDRDLWRFALLDSRDVSAALQELPVGVSGEAPDFAAWDEVAARSVADVARDGRCHRKTAERLARAIASTARATAIAGRPCLLAGTSVLQSEVGELLACRVAPGGFGATCFQREDGAWVYSLRSQGVGPVDVSEVARRFGGGGHAQAAGFVSAHPVHQSPERSEVRALVKELRDAWREADWWHARASLAPPPATRCEEWEPRTHRALWHRATEVLRD